MNTDEATNERGKDMYALFLHDETGYMVKDDTADNYLDALKIAAAWVEELKTGYSVIIRNYSGLGL